MSKTKEYTNGEVTIVWQADKCIHSENCVKGLPGVFDPSARPWINADGANTQEIVAQVRLCPSGALATYMNDEAPGDEPIQNEQIVEVAKNGPLMVYGNITVKNPDGSRASQHNVTAFCRCGASSNKPYCDGSHKKVGFEG
ncbi:MAG: (4Fe-4S)-binding protein [Cyclobacteriaceae bacterium]